MEENFQNTRRFKINKNGVKFCLVASLLIGIAFLMSGCAAVTAIPDPAGASPGAIYNNSIYPTLKDSHTQYQFNSQDFVVLGTVTTELKSINILGVYGAGDNGYGKLLEEAKKKYPDTDALVNVYWDTKYTHIILPYPSIPIFIKADSVIIATAIKLKKR